VCAVFNASPRVPRLCRITIEVLALDESRLIAFNTEQFMDIMETIREQLEGNRIILYMKGSPNQPQCGFSARTVQALMSCGERFAYVDVLSSPEIRANLPTYANWPTFPQLWVDGELIGGCDIVCDMEASGELKELVSAGADEGGD
jgi:monothiol glutaredoxin